MTSSASKSFQMVLSTTTNVFTFAVDVHLLLLEYVVSQIPHTADVESSPPPHQRQTTAYCLQQRSLDNFTSYKLLTAIAKWLATACRLINIV